MVSLQVQVQLAGAVRRLTYPADKVYRNAAQWQAAKGIQ